MTGELADSRDGLKAAREKAQRVIDVMNVAIDAGYDLQTGVENAYANVDSGEVLLVKVAAAINRLHLINGLVINLIIRMAELADQVGRPAESVEPTPPGGPVSRAGYPLGSRQERFPPDHPGWFGR